MTNDELATFIKQDWGGFETISKSVAYPADVALPKTRLYKSSYLFPMWAGFYVDVSEDANTIGFLFPKAWAESTRSELKKFLAKQPSNSAPYATRLAWTVHTAWLTVSYLLSTNVYPQLWSDALRLTQNAAWAPDYGWDTSFDWLFKAENSDILLNPFSQLYQVGGWVDSCNGPRSCSACSPPTPLTWCDTSNGIPLTMIDRWFAPNTAKLPTTVSGARHLGFKLGPSDFSGGYYAAQWSAHVPWAGIPMGSAENLSYFKDNAKRVDAKHGIFRLASRAALFGGLTRVYADSKDHINYLLVYWATLGKAVAAADYQTFVQSGVQAWKLRALYPLQPKAVQYEGDPWTSTRLPMALEDVTKVVATFIKNKDKSFRRGFGLKLGGQIANFITSLLSEDFYGTVKSFWVMANSGMSGDKTGPYAEYPPDPSGDPTTWTYVIPPMFTRVYATGHLRVMPLDNFSVDVKNPATKKTEKATGTNGMYVVVERAIHSLEKSLGFSLYDPSTAMYQTSAIAKGKKLSMKPAAAQPVVAATKRPLAAPLAVVSVATAASVSWWWFFGRGRK